MADAVMADKKIDPHELRRQQSQRELQRQTARQKCRETNPDSDPISEELADSPPDNKPKLKESDITGLKEENGTGWTGPVLDKLGMMLGPPGRIPRRVSWFTGNWNFDDLALANW